MAGVGVALVAPDSEAKGGLGTTIAWEATKERAADMHMLNSEGSSHVPKQDAGACGLWSVACGLWYMVVRGVWCLCGGMWYVGCARVHVCVCGVCVFGV